MPRRARCVCFLLAAALTAGAATLASRAAEPKGPSDEEIAKIKAACAQLKARVQPKKPRKVLVYSVSHGYFHTAIPYGQAAIPLMGEATGAFDAVVSDDPAMFEPDRLETFDAVVFNNANRDVFRPTNFKDLPAEEKMRIEKRDAHLKASFRNWLAAGRGIVATHAASNMFREWPEFGEILGSRFWNHPWGAGSTVIMKVEDPDHPLCQAFDKQRFPIVDEVYQLNDPYSRDLCRVLVSIDTERTDMEKVRKQIRRTDGDFAMTYIKTYKQGRVFYNAWGHMHELFWNPMVLQHWLDGIQYALGDLEADATPSAKK
jgi:hypothetical protein